MTSFRNLKWMVHHLVYEQQKSKVLCWTDLLWIYFDCQLNIQRKLLKQISELLIRVWRRGKIFPASDTPNFLLHTGICYLTSRPTNKRIKPGILLHPRRKPYLPRTTQKEKGLRERRGVKRKVILPVDEGGNKTLLFSPTPWKKIYKKNNGTSSPSPFLYKDLRSKESK